MGYTLFFVILAAIGALTFVGIFESGWLSSSETPVNETQKANYNKTTGKEFEISTNNVPIEEIFESGWLSSSETPVNKTQKENYNQTTGQEFGISTNNVPIEESGRKIVDISKLPSDGTSTTQYIMLDSSSSLSPPTVQPSPQQPYSELLPFDTDFSNNCLTMELFTAESGNISSPNYPEPYPTEVNCTLWLIDIGLGYSIKISIEALDLNLPNDFLLVGVDEKEMMSESNPILIGKLTSTRQFLVLNRGKAFILFQTYEPEPNATDSTSTGFFLSYEQYGNMSVTTEEPITEPTPIMPGIDADIKVYLEGKTQNELLVIKRSFQDVVANMSAKYCNTKNISLMEDPVYKNVIISLIGPCLATWPNSEICTEVNMSVPLNTTSGNYSLTRIELQEMWDTMAAQEDGLRDLGLQVYQVPSDSIFMVWVGISIGVIAAFVVLLILIWRVQIFKDYNRLITKPNEAKDSKISMDSFIEVPPNFPGDFSIYNDVIPQYNIPPTDQSSDFEDTTRNSISRSSLVQQGNYYSPSSNYGPPEGFSAALHFYGQNKNSFNNLSFVEEEEYETKSRAGTYDINELETSKMTENKHNNSQSLKPENLYDEPKYLVKTAMEEDS